MLPAHLERWAASLAPVRAPEDRNAELVEALRAGMQGRRYALLGVRGLVPALLDLSASYGWAHETRLHTRHAPRALKTTNQHHLSVPG